jgi:hypothetical protein
MGNGEWGTGEIWGTGKNARYFYENSDMGCRGIIGFGYTHQYREI